MVGDDMCGCLPKHIKAFSFPVLVSFFLLCLFEAISLSYLDTFASCVSRHYEVSGVSGANVDSSF